MKYWRGYLVAAICVAITWALVQFAQAHSVLVDMIYPYMTRLVVTSMAKWTGDMAFCLWQVLIVGMVVVGIVTLILMIVLRWNFFQWLGWVAATVCCVFMLHTLVYGLNQYASPLADDVRLEITEYTVTELSEATAHFRDQANTLSAQIKRDSKGQPDIGSFEELAAQAGQGFTALTYDQAVSVFAGSTVPVKKLGWSGLYGKQFGVTVALTGEAAVNPNLPAAVMPFAMCNEMAHRMSIYSEADAAFGAFLAGTANSSELFQYSAYMMAYHYCQTALEAIPTTTAQAAAKTTAQGVSDLLRKDLDTCRDYFGKDMVALNERPEIPAEITAEDAPIRFSEYDDVTDLLANWYVEKFIAPLHREEETVFDPLDPSQVDLTGIVNAK